VLGSSAQLFLDDWQYFGSRRELLAREDVAGYLLRPHQDHWYTVCTVIFHALAALWGTTFLPYLVVLIVCHLAVVAALRLLLLRLDVPTPVAGAVPLLVLVFGSGWSLVVWPSTISYSLPLAGFLAHLLLVDHDGPADRRDAWGTGLAIVGVMTAGIGALGVAAVTGLLVARRRFRPAVIAAVPSAVALGVWWLAYGDREIPWGTRRFELRSVVVFPDTPDTWARFVVRTFGAVGRSLVPVPGGAGIGMAAVLSALAVVVVKRPRGTGLALTSAAFAAMFALSNAKVRAWTAPDVADRDRYVYLQAVLVLPVLVLGCAAGVRAVRSVPARRVAGAVLVGALGFAVVRNVQLLLPAHRQYRAESKALVADIRLLAAFDELERVPPDVAVNQVWAKDLSAGHVQRLVRTGMVEPGPEPTPQQSVDLHTRYLVDVAPAVPGDAPAEFVRYLFGRVEPTGDGCHRVVSPGRLFRLELAIPPGTVAGVDVRTPGDPVIVSSFDETSSSFDRPVPPGGPDLVHLRLLSDRVRVALGLPDGAVVCGIVGLDG